jgi:hypothetical protein
MYFVNPLMFEYEPIKIANIAENGDIKNTISRFIAIYEKQCLVELLGECLAKELIDSFEIVTTDGVSVLQLKSDATDPIKHLVNGFSYTKPATDFNFPNDYIWNWNIDGCGCGCGSSSCTTRNWKGLVQNETILIGTATTEIKSSLLANYIYYYYLLINRTVTAGTGQQVIHGENSTTTINASKRIDAYNEFINSVLGKQGQTSLYQFLHDNKDDYPTWQPNCSLNYKTKY